MRMRSTKWKVGERKILLMKIYQDNTSSRHHNHHASALIIGIGDSDGHVDRNIDGFQGVVGGFSVDDINHDRRMLLEFHDARHLCIANTKLRKADKKR